MSIPQETSVGQSPTKPLVLVLLKQSFALLLMFSCSLVFPQKTCSSVLKSSPKNMFFCSHVFPQKLCSSVLLSFPKTMFFCSPVFPKTMFTCHKYLSEEVTMYRLVSNLPLFRLCKRFHAKCNGFHAFFDTTYKIS